MEIFAPNHSRPPLQPFSEILSRLNLAAEKMKTFILINLSLIIINSNDEISCIRDLHILKVKTEEALRLFACKTQFLLIFHNLFRISVFFLFSIDGKEWATRREKSQKQKIEVCLFLRFSLFGYRDDGNCRKGLMKSRAILAFPRLRLYAKTPPCIISSHKTYK